MSRLSSFAVFVVVKYPKRFVPLAFVRAGLDPLELSRVKGLLFSKVGGTGRGLGFSVKPNWSRYVLFTTWESKEDWERFRETSWIYKRFEECSTELGWIALEPTRSAGKWDGDGLFLASEMGQGDGPIAILTRATIHLSRMTQFWSEVEPVSRSLETMKGLRHSVGFGEIPWFRQATFSVWDNEESLMEFAYNSKDHKRVIKRTRDENWYKEELFARFSIVDSFGSLKIN